MGQSGPELGVVRREVLRLPLVSFDEIMYAFVS